MTEDPLLPEVSPEAVAYWEGTRAQRLLIQRCRRCGRHQFYPRELCVLCHATDLEFVEASGRATVYSHTTVMRAPSAGFTAPYVIAIVTLDEGPRMLTRIYGAASCDQRVRLTWEALPDGRHLPVFTPEKRGRP